MNLAEKKDYILNVVPLGIPYEFACIQAHLTQSQVETLDNDRTFQLELAGHKNYELLRLLNLYKKTTESAAENKLDSKGIRDRLELLAPEVFSKKAIDSRAGDFEADTQKAVDAFRAISEALMGKQ